MYRGEKRMNERLFRDAMSKFATGITVVTINNEGKPAGMTVNAFMSISLNPKLIAISIDKSASMYDQFERANQFGISMLKEEQKALSMFFARQKEMTEKIQFDDLDGAPVLQNSLATLSCRVYNKVMAGDHLIYILKVTAIEVNEGDPTIFFNGSYHELTN